MSSLEFPEFEDILYSNEIEKNNKENNKIEENSNKDNNRADSSNISDKNSDEGTDSNTPVITRMKFYL